MIQLETPKHCAQHPDPDSERDVARVLLKMLLQGGKMGMEDIATMPPNKKS